MRCLSGIQRRCQSAVPLRRLQVRTAQHDELGLGHVAGHDAGTVGLKNLPNAPLTSELGRIFHSCIPPPATPNEPLNTPPKAAEKGFSRAQTWCMKGGGSFFVAVFPCPHESSYCPAGIGRSSNGDIFMKATKLKEKFTQADRDEMVLFANSITPPSWNVFEDHRNCKDVPGTLNIHLDIRDADEEKDSSFHGMVHGGLSIRNKVAHAHVVLQPALTDWQSLIIHELAHVALFRWVAFRTKMFRKPLAYVVSDTYCYYVESINGGRGIAPELSKELRGALHSPHGKTFRVFEKHMKVRWRRWSDSNRQRE